MTYPRQRLVKLKPGYSDKSPHRILCAFSLSIYLFVFKTLMTLNSVLYLAVPCGMQDLSSPTKDRTCASCGGSTESYLLDHQGSPSMRLLSGRPLDEFSQCVQSFLKCWPHSFRCFVVSYWIPATHCTLVLEVLWWWRLSVSRIKILVRVEDRTMQPWTEFLHI